MENLEKIHDTINSIAEDPRVTISKIDDYTFNIVIDGELMDSFDKLGEIQNVSSDKLKNILSTGDATITLSLK